MGIVGKAIEGGVCHDGIVEEHHPFMDVAVAGDYRRGPSVPLNDNFVEVIGLLIGKSLETEVVYDEQFGTDQLYQFSAMGVVGPALEELFEHRARPEHKHFMPSSACAVGEGICDKGLPHADRAAYEYVFLPVSYTHL